MEPLLVVAGGPSLRKQTDALRAWKGAVFCCNRFTLWRNPPVSPDYYAVSASAVLRDVEPNNPPYGKKRFVVSRIRDQLADWVDDDTWTTVYKKDFHDPPMPGGDLLVRNGPTQAGVMVQIGAWMGYTDIRVVGIEQRGAGHMYDPRAKLDVKYFIPNEEKLFSSWRVIKDTYEDAGIRLRDSTPNGRLNEILEYLPLESAL